MARGSEDSDCAEGGAEVSHGRRRLAGRGFGDIVSDVESGAADGAECPFEFGLGVAPGGAHGGEVGDGGVQGLQDPVEFAFEIGGGGIEPEEPAGIVGRAVAVEVFDGEAGFAEATAGSDAAGELGGAASAVE